MTLLDSGDREVLAAVRVLLAEDPLVSPKVLSATLKELDISMTAAEAGWWLRRTGCFRKKRRRSGTLWAPIRPRLQRLYDQLGLRELH